MVQRLTDADTETDIETASPGVPARRTPSVSAIRGRRLSRDSGEVSDETLIAGMASGDEQAAVMFVRRFQRRCYGLAFSLIGEQSMAEDVAEEALAWVWRHAPVFDPRRGSVVSWVLTITRNLAVDAMRLRRAVPIDAEELAAMLGEDHRAEDAFAAPEVNAVVRRALATLAPDQRRALVLAALYGLTAQEVAERESIPLGTAKSRIRAGLSKLRLVVTEAEDPR